MIVLLKDVENVDEVLKKATAKILEYKGSSVDGSAFVLVTKIGKFIGKIDTYKNNISIDITKKPMFVTEGVVERKIKELFITL